MVIKEQDTFSVKNSFTVWTAVNYRNGIKMPVKSMMVIIVAAITPWDMESEN